MKDKVFSSIREACEITGLSRYYLRQGCKAGTIPHVVVGTRYRINMPLLLKQLDEASQAAGESRPVEERAG